MLKKTINNYTIILDKLGRNLLIKNERGDLIYCNTIEIDCYETIDDLIVEYNLINQDTIKLFVY